MSLGMMMSLDSGTAKDILRVTALVTISQRSGYHSLPLSLPSLSPSETPLQIEFEELLFKLRGRKTEAIETIRDDDGGVVQDGHPHCCKWERASCKYCVFVNSVLLPSLFVYSCCGLV